MSPSPHETASQAATRLAKRFRGLGLILNRSADVPDHNTISNSMPWNCQVFATPTLFLTKSIRFPIVDLVYSPIFSQIRTLPGFPPNSLNPTPLFWKPPIRAFRIHKNVFFRLMYGSFDVIGRRFSNPGCRSEIWLRGRVEVFRISYAWQLGETVPSGTYISVPGPPLDPGPTPFS